MCFLKRKDGSTLIWAMIVVVIITIVLAAGLSMVQRQQNSAVTQHIETQAYYSAMSVTQALIEWLTGASGGDPESSSQMSLINWILEKQKTAADSEKDGDGFFVIPVNSGEFLETLGTITVKAKYDSSIKTIYIKTHAEYAGQTASVTGTLTGGGGAPIIKPPKPQDPIFVDPPPIVNPPSGILNITKDSIPKPYPLDSNINAYKEVWLHEGAITLIPSGPGFKTEMIYILPGASVSGTQNGSYPAMNINFFCYSCKEGDKQAVLTLTGGNQAFPIKDIWIQPPWQNLDGSIGLCAKVTLPPRAANKDLQMMMPSGQGIHLPLYFNDGATIKTPLTKANITQFNAALNLLGIYPSGSLANVCNRPGMPDYNADTAPFCPHMQMNVEVEPEEPDPDPEPDPEPVDPEVVETPTVWGPGGGGFSRG